MAIRLVSQAMAGSWVVRAFPVNLMALPNSRLARHPLGTARLWNEVRTLQTHVPEFRRHPARTCNRAGATHAPGGNGLQTLPLAARLSTISIRLSATDFKNGFESTVRIFSP